VKLALHSQHLWVYICGVLVKQAITIKILTSWLPFILSLECQLEEDLKNLTQWELLLLSWCASGFSLGCLLVLDMLLIKTHQNRICHQFLWVCIESANSDCSLIILVLVLGKFDHHLEGPCWIYVDMDRILRLLPTLHSSLSVDERKPCLQRVQMVCVVLPAHVLRCQCPFNPSESIGNANVSASVSNPKPRSWYWSYRYPIVYCICIIPLSGVRLKSFVEEAKYGTTTVPEGYTFAVITLFGLSGFFNVILVFTTKPNLGLFKHHEVSLDIVPPSPAAIPLNHW